MGWLDIPDETWSWVPFRAEIIDWHENGIPDGVWNWPILGELRQAAIAVHKATRIPWWVWCLGALLLAALLFRR